MKNIDKQLNIDSIQNSNNKTTQKNIRQSLGRYTGLSKDTVSFKGTVAKGVQKITAEKAKTIAGVVASLVAFKTATTKIDNKENLDDYSITINGKTYPTIEGLKPKYITDEEANSIALQSGLTEEDIIECRKRYLNFNFIMTLVKNMIKYADSEEIGNELTRENVLEALDDLDNEYEIQIFPYLNDENIEKIKNEIGVDEINSVLHYIIHFITRYNVTKKSPKLISKLDKMTGVDSEGKTVPLYSLNDYPSILEAYQINEKLTLKLIELKGKAPIYKSLSLSSENAQESIYPLFRGEQVKQIVLMSKKYPELADFVINKAVEEVSKEAYYHRFRDFSLLIELYEKNPEFVMEKLNEVHISGKICRPRFSLDQLKDVMDEYSCDPDFINKLLNKLYNNEQGHFLYSGYDISRMIKMKNDNAEAYKFLSEITTIDYDGKERPLYSIFRMEDGIKLYEKDSDFFKYLVSFKDESGKLRFNCSDIDYLFASYEINPEITKKLIKMKKGENSSEDRLTAQKILDLVREYAKNSDFIDEIIDMKKLKAETEYRFSGYDFGTLIEAYKINPELTKKMLQDKDIKSGSEIYRHSPSSIKSLAEISLKNQKIVKLLLEMKLENGSYRFTGVGIKSLIDTAESNPEFLLLLANEKEDGKFLYSDKSIIEKFFNKFKNNVEDYLQARNWIVNNFNNGISFDEILMLYGTQQKFYREAGKHVLETQKSDSVKRNTTENAEMKSVEIIELEQRLVEIGLHPRMAENYVKLCHTNGIVDTQKADSICKLVKAYTIKNEKGKLIVGISPKDVENIFELALASQLSTQNGIFRAKLIDDIVGLKSLGVDDVKLAANISSIINMDEMELKSRINTKVREDVLKRFLNLSPEILSTLGAKGLSVDFVKSKAALTPKPGKINKENSSATATVRTLDSIVGVEKVVLNKFKSEIPQEIWSNPESFKRWAEERLAKILDFDANQDYIAVNEYAKYNEARIKGIESWYKFLKEESNYKDDVFVHLLVMDGITREMKPNNAYTPPVVSQGEFEATYNALLASDTKVSFSKLYAQQIRNKALQQYTTEYVSLNGIEGQWVTIPCSQRGDAKYDEHVAMVQALSEGSSWCLRFENAHTYLQQGNLHFFVDRNGHSQVAINETQGEITQIQKRYDQNSTVPIPYSEVISEWAKKNKYSGHEEKIQQALKQKPEFDSLRIKVQKLMTEKNYEAVFDLLDIAYERLPDGTYEIKNYHAKYNKYYTLNDLGINENELLANVSVLSSTSWNSSFEGSNVTSLPKLKKIVGRYDWGDCNIRDFSSLEEIGRCKIYWEK